MVNFEENLIKEYTANTVNKEDNTDINESDEEYGKESTQSKQNQCTIKSYREAPGIHGRCSRDRGNNDKCCS